MSESSSPTPSDNGGKPVFSSKSGHVAFGHVDYRRFWIARVLGVLAVDMQITAVSWQVYQLTGEPLDLGLVGLAQFARFLLLFLVAGAAADRFQRPKSGLCYLGKRKRRGCLPGSTQRR